MLFALTLTLLVAVAAARLIHEYLSGVTAIDGDASIDGERGRA